MGFGLSLVFAATMDDVIYADMKKNVIIPLQLARIRGDVSLLTSTAGIQGTTSFVKHMMPHGLSSISAKDLMLKDADYSTP